VAKKVTVFCAATPGRSWRWRFPRTAGCSRPGGSTPPSACGAWKTLLATGVLGYPLHRDLHVLAFAPSGRNTGHRVASLKARTCLWPWRQRAVQALDGARRSPKPWRFPQTARRSRPPPRRRSGFGDGQPAAKEIGPPQRTGDVESPSVCPRWKALGQWRPSGKLSSGSSQVGRPAVRALGTATRLHLLSGFFRRQHPWHPPASTMRPGLGRYGATPAKVTFPSYGPVRQMMFLPESRFCSRRRWRTVDSVGLDHAKCTHEWRLSSPSIAVWPLPVTEVSLPLEVAMGPSPCSTWCQMSLLASRALSGRVFATDPAAYAARSPKTLDLVKSCPPRSSLSTGDSVPMLGTPTHERNRTMSYVKSARMPVDPRGAIGRELLNQFFTVRGRGSVFGPGPASRSDGSRRVLRYCITARTPRTRSSHVSDPGAERAFDPPPRSAVSWLYEWRSGWPCGSGKADKSRTGSPHRMAVNADPATKSHAPNCGRAGHRGQRLPRVPCPSCLLP